MQGSYIGFWKTLGKIATIAAPIVAAPFTGGASLLAIGAGAGAANGALNGGGLKGALLGAGIGGASAGLLGGAGGAAGGAAGTGANVAKSSGLTLSKIIASPVTTQAIQTGGQLIGAGMQAHAAGKAADAQLAAQREALQFEQGVYNRDLADFAPYQTAGNDSVARLSELLKHPRPGVSAGDVFASGQLPMRSAGASRTPAAAMGGGMPPTISSLVGGTRAPSGPLGPPRMVTLQAPNGRQQQVPEDQVDHFVSRGAVRIA